MKTNYLYQISAFLLGLILVSSCVKWEEFESTDVAAAPTVTVAAASVMDSMIVVDLTSSANGFVTAILLSGTGNAIPDSSSLLQTNVVYDAIFSSEVEANTAVQATFAGLVQDASYEVMAVSANADGVPSEVTVFEVTTVDTHAPMAVGGDPAYTYTASIPLEGTVSVVFDEYVMLGTGAFTFEGFYTGAQVVASEVSVAGNVVSLVVPADFPNREYIWLHWEDDAVVDASGNGVAAQTTYFDGDAGAFVGSYWRMIAADFAVETVAPDVAAAQAVGFDIVLTFGDAVSISAVEDGDITLTYDDGAGIVTTVDVPAADVSAAGADVTIAQTVFTPAAGTVTVDIPAGVLSVGIGNPSAAFTATWDLQ